MGGNNMTNNEESKKSKKGKVAFMFAFAVTVLGSCAATAAASSVTDSGDGVDGMSVEDENDSKGFDTGYRELEKNIYVATDRAETMKSFRSDMNAFKGFGSYSVTHNGGHVEGNIAAAVTPNFYVFNSNVAQHVKDGNTHYVQYLDAAPENSNMLVTIAPDTTYEFVFGFDFERFSYGENDNCVRFRAGGKEYAIECGGAQNTSKFTLTRADDSHTFKNIAENLNNIGESGVAVIDAVEFSAADSADAMKRAAMAIALGEVQPGETMVINVHADDLQKDTESYKALVMDNKGVNIVINVIIDGASDEIFLGNVNSPDWCEAGANVTFNFGSYTGHITSGLVGGIYVAPYASFTVAGNVNGSVIANDIEMVGEIHQITSTAIYEGDDVFETEKDSSSETSDDEGEITEGGETEEESEGEITEKGDTEKVEETEKAEETEKVEETEKAEEPEDVEDIDKGEEPEEETEVKPEEKAEEKVEEKTEEEPGEKIEEETEVKPGEEIEEEPGENTTEDESEEGTEDEITEEESEEETEEESEEETEEDVEEDNEDDKEIVDTSTNKPDEKPSDNENLVEDDEPSGPVTEVKPEVEDSEPTETVTEVKPEIKDDEPTDEPTNEIVEIDDDEVPKGSEPSLDFDMEDEDSDVDPVIGDEPEPDDGVDYDNVVIIDDEVPMAEFPYTGVEDAGAGLAVGAAGAAAVAAAALLSKKRKKDN